MLPSPPGAGPASLPAINSPVSAAGAALCCSASTKLRWFSLGSGELLLLFHFLPPFPQNPKHPPPGWRGRRGRRRLTRPRDAAGGAGPAAPGSAPRRCLAADVPRPFPDVEVGQGQDLPHAPLAVLRGSAVPSSRAGTLNPSERVSTRQTLVSPRSHPLRHARSIGRVRPPVPGPRG